jgi:hypothetical protein
VSGCGGVDRIGLGAGGGVQTAAIVQKRWHPDAQALLARHEPTKGSRGARRILQRHLIDVIHRAMTTDQASWKHHVTRYEHAA